MGEGVKKGGATRADHSGCMRHRNCNKVAKRSERVAKQDSPDIIGRLSRYGEGPKGSGNERT